MAEDKRAAMASAQRQFYADLPEPRSAREECEGADGARELLIDEAAEKLRGRGFGAAEAVTAAEAVFAVLSARDKSVVAELVGEEEAESALERALAEIARLREAEARQKEAMAQIWAWPDARKGVGAWFFAHGYPLYGCNSMRALAELRQCSVEDISNVVDELQRIQGLPRNAQQKSEAAVESYRRENGAPRQKCAE